MVIFLVVMYFNSSLCFCVFHVIQDKHMAALVSERFSSTGKLKVQVMVNKLYIALLQIKFLKNWAIIQLPYNSDRSSICTIVILADDIPHWDVVTYSRKLLIKIISFMTFIAQLGLLILLVWPFFLESEAGTTFTVVFSPLFLLIAFKSYATPCNFFIILDISAHLLLQFVHSIACLNFIF